MPPVNVRLMGDPDDIEAAAALIIAAAADQGWTATEPSRPYPNHGGPGVRVFFNLTRENQNEPRTGGIDHDRTRI
jgi:hypothetical protein